MNKLFLILALVCIPVQADVIINGKTITGADVVITAPGYTITKTVTPTPIPPVPTPTPIPTPIPTPKPTPGTCPSPTIAGYAVDWSRVFGYNWPDPKYRNRYYEIPKNGYVAIRFRTGNIQARGKLTTIETTTTDGVRLGTISQCRGKFTAPAECKHIWGQGGGISWSTNGYAGACQLKANTTYYFNIMFTSCRTQRCLTTLQVYRR